MKTVEELLRDRYKVAGPYPFSPYNVGDIITVEPDRKYFIASETCRNTYSLPNSKLKDMPNIFQPLPWWSNREIEEMPMYVKSIKQEYDHGVVVGKVIKVKEWVLLSETMYVFQSKTREYHPSCFVPATREEYELFKQQKEK